jgi:hypothetical protein
MDNGGIPPDWRPSELDEHEQAFNIWYNERLKQPGMPNTVHIRHWCFDHFKPIITALQARFKEVFGPAGFKSVSNLMDERDLWKERVDREQNLIDEFRIERDTLATENAKLNADLDLAVKIFKELTDEAALAKKNGCNLTEISICGFADGFLSKLSSRKDGGT